MTGQAAGRSRRAAMPKRMEQLESALNAAGINEERFVEVAVAAATDEQHPIGDYTWYIMEQQGLADFTGDISPSQQVAQKFLADIIYAGRCRCQAAGFGYACHQAGGALFFRTAAFNAELHNLL